MFGLGSRILRFITCKLNPTASCDMYDFIDIVYIVLYTSYSYMRTG